MNELTEIGPLNGALARRYGGQSPLIWTMASDAFPVVPISDDQLDADLHFLNGTKLCAGGTIFTPTAGEIGSVGIRNPTGSGIIVTVEALAIRSSATAVVIVRADQQTAAFDTLSAFQSSLRDSRWMTDSSQVGGVIGLADSGAVAPNGRQLERQQILANVPYLSIVPPFVMAPGSQLWATTTTADVALGVNFRWRERRQVSQERNP